MTAGHVVLLGDSIFDNKVYVGQDPAVIDQVREVIPKAWEATLLAVDGDVVRDVAHQSRSLPDKASHLVVSAGGNDALGHIGVLTGPARTREEVFLKLANIQSEFARFYESMLNHIAGLKKPVAVCTIYDPNFEKEEQRTLAKPALTIFNDIITRAAFQRGIDVIDLRLIFNRPADYANPIEPSAVGGKKLASAIQTWLGMPDASHSRIIC